MALNRDDIEGAKQRDRAHAAFAVLCFALAAVTSAVLILSSHADADNVQTSITISICGNGIVDQGELCDDGINLGGFGSTTAERKCEPGCESYGPYCGDGILQARFSEQCDLGTLNGGSSLCSTTCQPLPAVPPTAPPATPVGSTPFVPGATPGSIPSVTQTQVVLRGKAYPNSQVHILLDGKEAATTLADSNANFLYSSTQAPAGIATYSFWANDSAGATSLTTSVVFDVVQSAVTSVNNIFLPPTLSVTKRQVAPGSFVNLFGESVPTAQVITNLDKDTSNALSSTVDGSGKWALQLDTNSISAGLHTAKVSFVLSTTSKSGYGKSLSFFVGNETPGGACGDPDINGDKKINLVDFSIFLLSWGTSNASADFNCDGNVNLADFSILLFNWTG